MAESSAADPRVFLADIESICRAAGDVQMRHFRHLAGYEKKGAIDLLTIADKESEALVVESIRALHPGHAILAEEGGATGPESDYLWVIDPLDGTTNFAHGVPLFAVSIGLLHKGRVIAGGVYGPALGDLYLAARGHGATRNGTPLRVSRVDVLDDALIVTGFPYNRGEIVQWLMGTMGNFLRKSQGMLRLGAAALDLAFVAAGNIDGYYEANLHPWDMAAGSLLVEEAGGRMSAFDGAPFDIFAKRMLASNGSIHDAMISTLAELPLGG